MKVIIETIPHAEQRYETIGDWQWSDGGNTLTISVSELGDWRYEAAVAYHELREALHCKALGVSQEEVDAFDMAYEAKRTEGDLSEPGDDPAAPYFLAHQLATADERRLIADLGAIWADYEKAVEEA